MKKLGRILLAVVAVLVALTLVVMVIRFVNGRRYAAGDDQQNRQDPASYSLTHPGTVIERVDDGYLHGLHLRPTGTPKPGLVVVYSGSEGGMDHARATLLAQNGYEVLSLFFFGQPDQPKLLSRVPLDHFDRVLAWRDAHAPGPLTVLGTSKGAELALELQTRYPQIDHVVVFTPTTYAWAGLDYTKDQSSWTWRGQDVAYVSFRHADPAATRGMFWSMLFNTPLRLREQYATAARRDPNAERARIPVDAKRVLAFAGDRDAMWPGDEAARELGARGAEAHVHPGAGHVFGDIGENVGTLTVGGTPEANRAAKDASEEILLARLGEWHLA